MRVAGGGGTKEGERGEEKARKRLQLATAQKAYPPWASPRGEAIRESGKG